MRKLKANGRNSLAAMLVVLATLLSVSCGGTPKSNSSVANAGSLVFNTASLDFGAVALNSSRQASVTVTNSSAADGGSVSVSKITVTGAGFSLATPTNGFSLMPGESATVTMTFAPKSAGNAVGQLSILVAGTAGPGNISLTGSTIVGNKLVVSPATLSFGSVAVGNSKTLTGTLSTGNADVTISSASWNGQGYSITGIDFPVIVPAGSSISYTVTFAPQASGAVSGGIIFVSDATNTPTTQTFTGSGGMVSQATQHSVSLSWNLASSVSGYNIYRGTHSGGPYTRLNAGLQTGANFTDTSVKPGVTYYYVATSVDSGVESPYSDEVVAAIPSP